MGIIERLVKEHGEMLGILDQMVDLLAQAGNIRGERRAVLVGREIPELEKRVLDILKRHEREEMELFSRADPDLNDAVDHQHMEIDEVFRIASALIYLKDPGNLHAIHFALKRIQDDLKQHFSYEERVIFPLLPEEPRGQVFTIPASGPGSADASQGLGKGRTSAPGR